MYSLTLSADPPDGGTVELVPPGGSYVAGTEVTLTAVPAPGYTFDHWSGIGGLLSVPDEETTVKITGKDDGDAADIGSLCLYGIDCLKPATIQFSVRARIAG